MATRIEVQARRAASAEDIQSAKNNVRRLMNLAEQMNEMGMTEMAANYEGEAFGIANRLGLAQTIFPWRFQG